VNVAGGSGATGTVTLTGSAPNGGADVPLVSDNASVVSVPSHVTVRKGDSTATFAITTFAVTATQTIRVSGSYGGLTQHDTLTVIPASAVQLTNLTITPSSVSGGTTATGTITMTAPAPTGGLLVSLASRHRNFATVPSGVTVPGGATTASFTIAAQAVKSTHTVDLTATYASVTKTAPLTVTKNVASLSVFERIASLFRHVPLSLSVSTRVAQPLATGVPSRYSLYTPELNLMAESETTAASSPAISYEYVWFGGQPVAQLDVATNTTHWTFTDHLGTPILQTNATGAVDWRVEYEPYGTVNTIRAGSVRHQPLRFPGQEFDDSSPDRNYNIFRWYRGGWGRYAQSDPVGLGSDINLYAYVSENPLTIIDPFGLKTFNWSWGPPPHPSPDPASDCHRPGQQRVNTKVACTNFNYASLDCVCGCAGTGWEPHVTLQVSVEMYIYNGPIRPGMAHDRSIHDFDTAVEHELQKHLQKGADSVQKWLNSWMHDVYETKDDCEVACKAAMGFDPTPTFRNGFNESNVNND
jgi:RHS repeat-associated protein